MSPPRVAEQTIYGFVRFGLQIAITVIHAMIHNGCNAILIQCQIADRALLVGQRPNDVPGGAEIVASTALTLALSRRERGQGLIRHQLIHGVRLPEVTVGEVGNGQGRNLIRAALTPSPSPACGRGEISLELQHDLIAIVDKADGVVNHAVAALTLTLSQWARGDNGFGNPTVPIISVD
jgi:hypothetical protein